MFLKFKMSDKFVLSEMISQRGKTLLVLKNFKFKEHNRKLASGETKWRCIQCKCKAYIHTLGEASARIVTSADENHNHLPVEENLLKRQMMSVSAKRKAQDDICEKPSKIIRTELSAHISSETNLTTSDLNCVRKNIYYARRKILPPLPTSIADVHKVLDEMPIRTVKDENFLLLNDSSENLVIFSCFNNLTYLCRSEIIYMDGTFSYCTKFFKQLFSLHGLINERYIPLVFCLLKDKSEKTYEFCLSKIQELCCQFHLNLSPKEIVIDFEKSIHNAVRNVWKNVIITGCRFHLTQSWYRKIQKLGLTQHYKDKNSEIGIWLRYCFGLLFLKAEDVEDFYFFELFEIKPENTILEKFSDYLVDTYLTKESPFPPHIWADASAALNKTTNACESFHSHFNGSMYNTHPSLFIFVKELLEVQKETYVKCNSVIHPYALKNAQSKKKNFIQDKIDKYKNDTLSKLDYIKIVSHYYSH